MTDTSDTEKTIFLEAVELAAPTERAAYVARACGKNRQLRAAVEALLAAHGQEQELLDATAVTHAERPGTQIGPYKLLQQIGEGGMGVVYMAEQTEPIARRVALKIIKPGMDSRQVIARFEAERQALSMMDHVNISRVLDAGTTDAGLPYFVMELVHGLPITKYCDDNRLTPRQRLELFVPVCQAIQHAHQKGIIHRDIKPSNVMVTLYDGKAVPKVIDFGVAKATEQKLTERTLFTQYGMMIGTLEYMSPEQAEMSALGADTRSDIFSLGVLLYELLTGSTPLSHKRLKDAAYGEVLRMIREEEAPKPSTRLSDSGEALASISANRHMEPAKLTRLVRGELDWIVMKTLEKDRNRRYETANGLAMDVQRYLADEPVLACPPSAGYRVRKFVRRNMRRLAVAAGVFLAATVMAASIGWAMRDRVARQAAIEQAETARQATVAGQVRDSLNTARTLIAENKLATAREKLAQAKAQLGNDRSPLAAEVEAGAADLDRLQQFLNLIDRAHQAETAPLLEPVWTADGPPSKTETPILARSEDRRRAAVVPFLLEALQLYGVPERDDWNSTWEDGLLQRPQVEQIRRLAYEELLWLANDVLRRKQEHRSGERLSPQAAARAALVYLDKAAGARRPTQALYAQRADCRQALGEEAAAQADRELCAKTPPTIALDQLLQGMAAQDANQLAEAVRAYEAALRLEPTHYWSMLQLGGCLYDLGEGPEDFIQAVRVFSGCIMNRPDHAHAFCCRANAYAKLRRYGEALADGSRALELEPQSAKAWYSRGVSYVNLGQPDKALSDFSKAIELDPQDARSWNYRGGANVMLGRTEAALADFSRAIERDPHYSFAWTNRGFRFADLGRHDEALADFSKSIEMDPKYMRAWYGRGTAHLKLRQPDNALADFSQAIELEPNVANVWYHRANTYASLGRLDEANSDFSKAIEIDPKFTLAWSKRGSAYLNRGQLELALADFSKVIELDPKDARAWYIRGRAYLKLARPDEAASDFTKAIELYPKFTLAWACRGAAYLNLGQPHKAIADCSQAIEQSPKVVIGWQTLGVAHYRTGDWQAAVAALEKSVELGQGGDAIDRLFLAMAQWKLDNRDAARQEYQQADLWLKRKRSALELDKVLAEDLRRFRAEAEEVLELKKK